MIEERLINANTVFGFYPARSVNDSIELYDESTGETFNAFHFLRNQEAKEEGVPNLCLADFVAPAESGIKDYMGFFAVTAGIGVEKQADLYVSDNDDYNAIMIKILADRFAEAFTELLHKRVRRELWGYDPDEELEVDQMLAEEYSGIRPAPGYPACPEHSEKENLFSLLDVPDIGVNLTENYAMYPAASVCGYFFSHPDSQYFSVGRIGPDQVQNYADRKGIPVERVEKLLAQNLNY